MTKSAARKILRQKRAELSIREKSKLDDLLLIQFQRSSLPHIHYLLSYWPIEDYNEPNTHLFTDYIEFMNPKLSVCYPRTDFSHHAMQAILAKEGTSFAKNKFHIPEPREGEEISPEKLDMVFVPLLAFDTMGFRAGYGKGFYDRYLSGCREDCLKVGFSFFEPVDKLEDTDEFDIPLDLCVTPTATYVF
ncbi:MAG: 5-formyltetrahydrofolate cyclo-ligase [Terrimonas sp.]|nr:5-formyltetrahydrofolate cyclo-ligase [Terrimonas sp.]